MLISSALDRLHILGFLMAKKSLLFLSVLPLVSTHTYGSDLDSQGALDPSLFGGKQLTFEEAFLQFSENQALNPRLGFGQWLQDEYQIDDDQLQDLLENRVDQQTLMRLNEFSRSYPFKW